MDSTIPQNTPQKQCGKCERWKPATSTYFGAHRSLPDGLANTCKACRKEQYDAHRDQERQKKRQYHWQHRDERVKRSRQYYADHAEELREQKRQHRKNFKDVVDVSRQKYYESHKEQVKEYQREYRKSHPEQVAQYGRARDHNRRARKQMAEGSYTIADVQKQYANQNGTCYYCKVKLAQYHVDHIIPLSRGGSNTPDNLVVACPPCNRSKGNKLLHEWHQGSRLL